MAKRTCMETALAKLNYRMRTVHELTVSLKELGFESEEIEETIEELKSFGYLDDLRYGVEFFRSSRKKNWSGNRIMRAMREKGLDRETIAAVMDEMENSEDLRGMELSMDDRETALKEGLRMAKSQEAGGRAIDEKFLGKVGRRLTSLGYDPGCCYYVIGKLRDRISESEEEEIY